MYDIGSPVREQKNLQKNTVRHGGGTAMLWACWSQKFDPKKTTLGISAKKNKRGITISTFRQETKQYFHQKKPRKSLGSSVSPEGMHSLPDNI